VGLGFEIAASGRLRPPSQERAEAVRAFEQASGGVGAAWAPSETRAAGDALRAALVEWSRQESRFFALRDFRGAAAALDRARAAAVAAANAGAERREVAREAAELAVAEAQELEGHATALVGVTALPHAQRARLARARLLVREAEALAREGDVAAAAERARRSQDELRRAVGPALAAAERYRSQEQVATWRRWIEDAGLRAPGPAHQIEIDESRIGGPDDLRALGVAAIDDAPDQIHTRLGDDA